MSSEKSSANYPVNRVYGRRQSRPLNKSRKEAMDTLLQELSVPADLLKPHLCPDALFDTPFNDYRLEIGFGNGEHLLALVQEYPETGFIGVEPYINGMAAFLKDLKGHKNQNVKVLMDDALLLVEALNDECLEKIYLLNPDPWPKKRHHKRRMVNQNNLDQFARVLKPGGQLIMATDIDDLAEWMATQCMMHPALKWVANGSKDWKNPPSEWIETRYAFKGRTEGRNQTFLVFEK